MTPNPAGVSGRLWLWIVLLGLTGQLAWTIENMYLNVFVHETITDDPTVLAVLVAASAIAATFATLLVGAWSDRVGRRREFIASGYVLWGLTTAGFGLVGVDSAIPNGVAIAVITIVLLDCVMSFLGSGANDAAFQAWVTDSTNPGNRTRIDGVLQTLPLLSMLIVFGALDPITRAGNWQLFFAIIGGLTTVVGLVAWFGIRSAPSPQPSGTYLSSVVHGLRPSTVRANPRLYTVLAAWAVLGISFQVYLPYLIIYVQKYLVIDAYAVVLACVLVGASVISIVGGRLLGRSRSPGVLLPVVGVYVLALLAMFAARGMVPVIVAGTLTIGTFLLAGAMLSATIRNLTPADRAGQIQGLRMIAVVLLPSVIGPFIGAAVISGADETYVDLGVAKTVPTPWIFVAAAVVAVAVIVPVRALRRMPGGVSEPEQETVAP
ncbi:MFS transporter [Occultella gossypii]|uniref:MFS transporter n=1 Tax=Occultella gossypii TaxID=2800820 RepID=A0ABS7S670_9MICO|nr:MFS transporter [Occultella gossypii]MBZ2195846.1 MFS transporter [Occultella gossypii]